MLKILKQINKTSKFNKNIGTCTWLCKPGCRLTNDNQDLSGKQIRDDGYCTVLVTQSCPTLCNSLDRSPPGSSVHGIRQARILEWIAIPFSRGSSQPRVWTRVACTAGRFFTTEPSGKPNCYNMLSESSFHPKCKTCDGTGNCNPYSWGKKLLMKMIFELCLCYI